MNGNMAAIGASIFVHIFAQCPELLPLFSIPPTLAMAGLHAYEPFERFARVFTTIIDMCVKQCTSTTFESGADRCVHDVFQIASRRQGRGAPVGGWHAHTSGILVPCCECTAVAINRK